MTIMKNKKEESSLIKGLKEFLDEVPPERLKELEKYNQFGPTVPDYLELMDYVKGKENIYLTSYKLRMELGDLKKNNTNGVECAVLRDAIDLLYRMENEIFELRKNGWHPASESPIIPENHNWISVVAIVCDMDDNSTRASDATFNKNKGWIFPEFSRVLYWCYRPKEN